jgi:quinol monooxygenase YgiN
MFDHAITIRIIPGCQTQALKLLQRVVIPILRAQPGIISLGVVAHPDQEQITILSEWRDIEAARAAESADGYFLGLCQLEPYLEKEPAVRPTGNN